MRDWEGQVTVEISIRLGAGFSPASGNPRLSVDLPDGATVADLIARLGQLQPELESQLSIAIAVTGGQPVAGSERLAGGQEVALLLPVSGGA